MLPIIFGFAGTEITPEERALFMSCQPFGYILFQRNCENPIQVRNLTAELRYISGREDLPILIDQEGGRVARLRPPHWPALPPLRALGLLYEQDQDLGAQAAILHSRITAFRLRQLGISVNCAPVLDLFIAEAASAIGDRAVSGDPDVVAGLARTYVAVHLEQNVLPVIKHLPGHGRVKVDPHLELPVIDASFEILHDADFVPFLALGDAPLGMTCHALLTALDPIYPVSMSPRVHQKIIRETLGFKGLLISDDLAMEALQGSVAGRAEQALAAGTDIALYCPGKLDEMRSIALHLKEDDGTLAARWQMAQRALSGAPLDCDLEEDSHLLAELLGKSVMAG